MNRKRFPSRVAQTGLTLLLVMMMLVAPASAATSSTQSDKLGCALWDLACWARLLTGGGSTNPTPVPTQQAPAATLTPAFQATWTPQPQSTPTALSPTWTPQPQWANTPVELIPADVQYQLSDANHTTLQLPKAMVAGINLAGWAVLIDAMNNRGFAMGGIPNNAVRVTAGNISGALTWTSLDLQDPQVLAERLNLRPYVGDHTQYYGLVLQEWQVQGSYPWPSGWEFQLVSAMFRRAMYWDSTRGALSYHYDYPALAAEWLQTNSLWTYDMGDEKWASKGQTFRFTTKSKVPFFAWPYAAFKKGAYGTRDDQPLGWLDAGNVVQGVPICGVFRHSRGDACDVFIKVDAPSLVPWRAFFVSVEDILGDGNTVPPEYRPTPTPAPQPQAAPPSQDHNPGDSGSSPGGSGSSPGDWCPPGGWGGVGG